MKDEVEKKNRESFRHMILLAWKNGDISMVELKIGLDSEIKQAQVEAVRAAVNQLDVWAIDNDLTRGSNKYVTFDVDEWNKIRASLTKEDGETK